MKINVISIMGEMIENTLEQGVVGRSFKDGRNELNLINPRQYTVDVHQAVDDRPYGGGDGMLMMAEPLAQCLDNLPPDQRGPLLLSSPQGSLFDDAWAERLAGEKHLTIICARYGGVDQRLINHYGLQEISIGNYVISGGELAAAVIIDAVLRKVPGVLGHADSAKQDSLSGGGFLESPSFTRPREWRGQKVPEVLLEGHHHKIGQYREWVGQLMTLQKRPDLLQGRSLDWQKLLDFCRHLSVEEASSLGLRKNDLLEDLRKRSQ